MVLLAVLAVLLPACAHGHLQAPTLVHGHVYAPFAPVPWVAAATAPVGSGIASKVPSHHGLTLLLAPASVAGAPTSYATVHPHIQTHGSQVKIFFTRFPPVIEGWVQRIQNYYSTYLLGQGIFPQDAPPPPPQPPLYHPTAPAVPVVPAVVPAVPAIPVAPAVPPNPPAQPYPDLGTGSSPAPAPAPAPAPSPGVIVSPPLQPFPQETPAAFPTFPQPAADASNNTATSVAVAGAGADAAGTSVPYPEEVTTEAAMATKATTNAATTTTTTTTTPKPFIPESTPYPVQVPAVQPASGPYHYPPPQNRFPYPVPHLPPQRSFRQRGYY